MLEMVLTFRKLKNDYQIARPNMVAMTWRDEKLLEFAQKYGIEPLPPVPDVITNKRKDQEGF